MEIEKLTLEEIRQNAARLRTSESPAVDIDRTSKNLGIQIVVLDRGFVYVGDASAGPEFVTLKNARNLRRWGTTAGLGELIDGPLPETKLDYCGELIITLRAVINFIKINKGF